MDWLREKIYEVIPDSKKLLLETMVIDKPIKEDEHISKIVEKYNEWRPETVFKNNPNYNFFGIFTKAIIISPNIFKKKLENDLSFN